MALKNCREWCRGLLEFMDRDDIYEKVNVQQITDLDQLCEVAAALNIELDQYSKTS